MFMLCDIPDVCDVQTLTSLMMIYLTSVATATDRSTPWLSVFGVHSTDVIRCTYVTADYTCRHLARFR